MGGPSHEAKENEKAQTAFYKQTTEQQSQVFGEQQHILKSIQDVTMPILKMGPNQYGFTPEEDALLRGEITDNAARSETNAVNATQLSARQKTGGTDVMPTGASLELEQDAHLLGEQQKSVNLGQERLAGYQAGNQRYAQALAALTGNAGLLSPTSYTTAATGAGTAATGAINLADSERSNLLGSLLGGAAQGVIGGFTGGLGAGLLKKTGLGG